MVPAALYDVVVERLKRMRHERDVYREALEELIKAADKYTAHRAAEALRTGQLVAKTRG